MTKKGAEAAAAASPPPATKKRPASPPPPAKAQKDHPAKDHKDHPPHEHPHHPLHDDHLPVDVVEEGKIYFFYRPRVAKASDDTSHAVSDVSDVAKTYMLLCPLAASDKNVGEGREALAEAEDRAPSHGRPLNRVFVIPRKTLPGRSGEPRLAIGVKVGESVKELTDGLKASTYETKTRGLRQQPAARVVARGAYMIVSPTAGPVARAAHKAQQHEEEEKGGGGGEAEEAEGEGGDGAEGKKAKKPRRATPAEKAAEAARAARHGRPVNSARLLWLLEAPRHDGPAQQMLSIEHCGAFVIKVKGPLGRAGGGGAGGGGGGAPPPPKADELPEPTKARLSAARAQWVEVDSHAALDFKGAQMLMVAQYGAGGTAGGPGSLEPGGIKQDRAAMAEEAGPEVAAALADLVADDERALKADARAHGEPTRGELGAALRRAMLRELSAERVEEGEEGEGEGDWAAQHHEEAEAQLRLHEKQEAEEEGEAGGGGEGAAGLVVDPAITGEIV